MSAKAGHSMGDFMPETDELKTRNTAFAVIDVASNAKSYGELLEFFEGHRGSRGMKHFWKSVFRGWSQKDDVFMLNVNHFMDKLINVLEGELSAAVIEAVMESGFVFTLVKLLEKGAPLHLQVSAMQMLGEILKGVREDKVGPIFETGVVRVLVNQLRSADPRLRMLAPVCLTELVKRRSNVMDEVVTLGGIHEMIRMLAKDRKEYEAPSILLFFSDRLREKPRRPLELYGGLPQALRRILGTVSDWKKSSQKMTSAILVKVFLCLRYIAEYGLDGAELLRKAGHFEVLAGALYSNLEGVKHLAMEVVVRVAVIKQEYRRALLKLGVLESFPRILGSPSDEIRQLTLFCLNMFLDERLGSGQTNTFLKMKPLVKAEVGLGLRLTAQTASEILDKMEEMQQSRIRLFLQERLS